VFFVCCPYGVAAADFTGRRGAAPPTAANRNFGVFAEEIFPIYIKKHLQIIFSCDIIQFCKAFLCKIFYKERR
jgi:hypothetical protein